MAADGLIVLGLDVSQTQANIQAELDSILNNAKTRKIILKTAIEKAETEREIDAVVAKLNKKTVKLGVEVDIKSVNSIVSAQQKIASTQAKLTSQMQEYRNTAKGIGVTLNKDTWNSFNHAVSSGDFTKANEILRSAKKQIAEYNAAVKQMSGDTSVSRNVSAIVEQFGKLKNVSGETKKQINLLKANLAQFENADSTQKKLSAYKRLQTLISSLRVELTNLASAEKTQSGDLGIKKKIEDARSSLEIFKIKYNDIGDSAAAQKVTEAITGLDQALAHVNADATGGNLKKQWDAVSAAVNNAKRAVSEYDAQSSVKSKNLNLLSGMSSQAVNLSNSVMSVGGSSPSASTLSGELRKVADDAIKLRAELDKTAATDQNYQKLVTRIDELDKRFRTLKKDAKVFEDTNSYEQFQANIEKARQKVLDYAKTYSAIKGNPTLLQNLDSLKTKLDAVHLPSEFSKWKAEFEKFDAEVDKAGLRTQSLGDRLKTTFKNFASFFSASRVIYQAFNGLKQMAANVKELDSAMVELRKVTSATDTEINSFFQRSKDSAVALGSTVTDLINATADFSRLGYSLDDAEDLAQVATVYKNVGDDINSIDDASSIIVTAMKAFNIEASDAVSIVDKLNEIGNKYAISSGDLGEGLTKAASYMATAGNSIDETLAMITAMTEITQDATESGNALKILAMRLRGAQTELAEAGESTDGMAESTSKLREKILALTNVTGDGGFDIMLNEDEFKSTYDIMEGISKVWDKMSDVNQASLIELIAGKQRGNSITALLTSMSQAENVLTTSLESSGSAMREQDIWLDSIEAKISQLKAAFESLSSTTIDSDFMKGLLDAGRGAVSILDLIIDKVGLIPTALGAISTFLSASGKQTLLSPFKVSYDSNDGFSGSKFKIQNPIQVDVTAIEKYNQAVAEAVANGKDLQNDQAKLSEIITQTMDGASQSTITFVKSQNGAEISTENLTSALIKQKAATVAAEAGQIALNAAVSMGTSFLIQLAVSGIAKLVTYEDDLIKKSEEAANSIAQIQGEFQDKVSSVDEIAPKFAELAQGVDSLTGKNISLSTDDYAEFLDLSNQLADLFPTLSRTYDENGNAIVNLSGNVDAIVGSLTSLLEVERQIANQDITDDLPDLYDGILTKSNKNNREKNEKDTSLRFLKNGYQSLSDVLDGKDFEKNLNDGFIEVPDRIADTFKIKLQDALKKAGLKIQSSAIRDKKSRGVEGYKISLTDLMGVDMSTEEAAAIKTKVHSVFEDLASDYATEIETLNGEISNITNKNKENWNGLLSGISAWMSTDATYQGMSDEMQKVVQNVVNGLDFSKLDNGKAFKTVEGVEDYIKTNIVDKLSDETPEVQNKFAELFSLDPSSLSISDYKETVNRIAQEIADASDVFDKESVLEFTGLDDSISIYDEQIHNIIDSMDGFQGKTEDLESYLNSLSPADLQNALSIVTNENITSVDELRQRIEALNNSVERVPKSYESLKTSVENATKSQMAMHSVVADNSHLTEDAYKAISSLVGGEEKLAGCVDATNGYLVTNAELLRVLVDTADAATMSDLKMAEAHERLNYHELVAQLYDVTDGLDSYDAATKQSISTILDQIDVTKLQIAQYALLEQQLLGTANAFTQLETAQQVDAAADYTDDLSTTIQTLMQSYENGEFGTETFWTGLKALVPEDIYGQFEEAGDQIEAGYNYIQEKLSRYFSYDGNSVSVDKNSIQNFVSDALSTVYGDSTVLEGTLEDFNLNPQITSLEEFADALGVTEEAAFALASGISKYSANNEDFLSSLQSGSSEIANLDNSIYDCDQRMQDLLEKRAQMVNSGEINIEDFSQIQSEISKTKNEYDDLQKSARKDIKKSITINDNIEEKEKEIDSLQKEVDELDEKDPNLTVKTNELKTAQGELLQLLQEKGELGEPTELTIQMAMEGVQSEIDSTKAKLDELATYDGTTYTANVKTDQTEVDSLAAKLKGLQAEKTEIEYYVELDDTGVEGALKDIEEFKIKDKKFNVTANGADAAYNAVNKIATRLAAIKNKSFTITQNVVTKGSILSNPLLNITDPLALGGDGASGFSGTAHAQGNWGIPTNEKDALVGELGEELVVDPRTGTYKTVGTYGAEFVDLPKGAIVFNHRQTEQILKNGRINSRGTAYAEGNAHFGFVLRDYKFGQSSSSNNTSGATKGSSNSGSGNSKNNTKNTSQSANVNVNVNVSGDIDIEERLKDTLDEMDKKISKAITSYEHKIFLMEKNDGAADDIIAIYKKMQDEVHKQSEEYRKLGLSENSQYIIDLQKQWWDYQDSIKELIVSQYEDAISERENAITLTENWLDQAVASGDYSSIQKYTSDIVGYYQSMQDAVHEEAQYYRSLGYAETSDEVSKLSDLWWEYQQEILSTSADTFSKLVDNASDAVDEIQNVYDTLKDAAKEYAESGFITVDTLQEIIGLGTQYLAFLQDENGQLVINEQNVQRVIAARTQQLAVEQALCYVEQLRTAVSKNDIASLKNLLEATDGTASSIWGLVYAQLASLNLNNDQFQAALQRINTLRSLSDLATTSIGKTTGELSKGIQDSSDALDDLLNYVINMIKQEVSDQIDKYKEIINLKKESLSLSKEENEYNKDVSKKLKDISKLQAQIQQLSLDDSREAQAERLKLEEELAEKQADLADKQSDYAYNATIDSLDKQAEAFEKEKQDSISSYEKLYQMAIERINNKWDTLYSDLIDWNSQYGSDTNEKLTEAWNNAFTAVQKYGSYLEAVKKTQEALNADSSSDSSSWTTIGNMGDYSSDGSYRQAASSIVDQMKANSAAWHKADGDKKAELDQANINLSKRLEQLLHRKVVRDPESGIWYLDEINGEKLYDVYHKGGVVGGATSLQDKETIAVLEKGELVLDEPKKKSLYKILSAEEAFGDAFQICSLLSQGVMANQVSQSQDENIRKEGTQIMDRILDKPIVISPQVDASVVIQGDVDRTMWDKVFPEIKRHSSEVSQIVNSEIMAAFHMRGVKKS